MADIDRLISTGLSRRAFVRLASAAAALPLMGGLLVATVLTVLFVPALYAAWFRVRPVKEPN